MFFYLGLSAFYDLATLISDLSLLTVTVLTAVVTFKIFLCHRPSPTPFMYYCPSSLLSPPTADVTWLGGWGYKCLKPCALFWEQHKTSVLAVKGLRFHREAPQPLLLIIHSSTHQRERVLATVELPLRDQPCLEASTQICWSQWLYSF